MGWGSWTVTGGAVDETPLIDNELAMGSPDLERRRMLASAERVACLLVGQPSRCYSLSDMPKECTSRSSWAH